MANEAEVWHMVEARREDGTPAVFRIRELAPRPEQSQIFVVEMPYPTTELSRLPDASAYRRLGTFEEQWLVPSCVALGWTFVATKAEDGSFFLYLYGSTAPDAMIERLAPFDGALGFFQELDAAWDEYAALRELIDEANALPQPPEERAITLEWEAAADARTDAAAHDDVTDQAPTLSWDGAADATARTSAAAIGRRRSDTIVDTPSGKLGTKRPAAKRSTRPAARAKPPAMKTKAKAKAKAKPAARTKPAGTKTKAKAKPAARAKPPATKTKARSKAAAKAKPPATKTKAKPAAKAKRPATKHKRR